MFRRVLILFAVLGFVCSVVVVVERANVTYINKKHLTFARAYVTRYGRKSPYYLNFEGESKTTWANNVTVNLIFYEYLHNEYRRSFVEMHYKYCDMLQHQHLGEILRDAGLFCPVPPAVYRFLNITVPSKGLPRVWPFQKAKMEAHLTNDRGEDIVKYIVYGSFLEDKRKIIKQISKVL